MPQPNLESRQHRLGEALSRLRERGGLSMQELARALSEGDGSVSEVAGWESGRTALTGVQLWCYLEALDLSFCDLDLELDPKARSSRLRELAAELDALGRL